MSWLRLAAAAALVLLATAAEATVVVRTEASATTVAVDETFLVELRADVTDAIVGFGLDLGFDDAIVEVVGVPVIGPLWLGVGTLDGDGLAGLAQGSAIAGADLLLATLTLRGVAPGATPVAPGFDAADLSEGFPLDPSGFDTDVTLLGVTVTVPEPGLFWRFAAIASSALALRRRR